jgi:hypothetical protein
MNRVGIVVAAAVFALGPYLDAQSCVPSWNIFNTNLDCLSSCTLAGYAPSNCPLCKTNSYQVTFPDGYPASTNLSATGAYNKYFSACNENTSIPYDPSPPIQCWPPFYSPTVGSGTFSVLAKDESVAVNVAVCGLAQHYNIFAACTSPGTPHTASVSHTCPCSSLGGPCTSYTDCCGNTYI